MAKRGLKYVLIVLVVAVIILIVVCFPLIKSATNQNLDKTFFGEKSEYLGVIELWHIDTFEGGTASRSRWLEKRAIEFESENKGLYIFVKNVSVSELENLLEAGNMPDLFSFSQGVQEQIKPYLAQINQENFKNVNSTLLESGKAENGLLAVPFCYSGYMLISQMSAALNAYKEAGNLSKILFETGYTKKVGKKEKSVYSCVYGGGGKTSPKNIIESLSLEKNDLSVLPESETLSSYEAYTEFVSGNANILVGTLRDVARIENKVQAGAMENVIMEPFSEFTDMVCYLGYTNAFGELRAKYASKFIEFCLSEKNQQKVANLGMLSPVVSNLYSSGFIKALEEMFSNKLECKNLFL